MNKLKLLLGVLFLLQCSTWNNSFGQTYIRSDYSMSGVPADGDSLTENGFTRTFKTTVATSASQILIGASASATVDNLATHFGTYGITNLQFIRNGTAFGFLGQNGAAHTASKSGSWGTLTLTTNPVTGVAFIVPQSALPSAVRVTNVDNLIAAFTYGSAQFGATLNALANYTALSTAQTVSGAKTFTGLNVYSNAASIYTLGAISNSVARALKLKQAATLSGVYMLNSGDTAVYTIAPDANGKPTLYGLTGDTLGTGPTYSPSADNILTRAIADNYYGRLASANTWSANNTFGTILPTLISGGATTNQVSHATVAYTDALFSRGRIYITNVAPVLQFTEISASANQGVWRFKADGDNFYLYLVSDAGTDGGQVFRVERVDETTVGAEVYFTPKVYLDGGVSISTGYVDSLAAFRSTEGAILGSTAVTMPTGMAGGLYLVDGAGPSGGAGATGSAIALWSQGGEAKYRNGLSGEGDATDNRVHNRTATTQGAGTDYTLTASTAAVDFSTTDPAFTAPTAGTYNIYARIGITAGGTDYDNYKAKLRNVTAGADISGAADETTNLVNAKTGTIIIMVNGVVLAAGDSVAIYCHNNSAARGTINSARTSIGYIRAY